MHPRLVGFLVSTGLALAVGPARAETPTAGEIEGLPSEPDPSFEVDMTLSGKRYSLSYPAAYVGTTSGNQETLSAEFTGFRTPLRDDDDDPYSLQPFMQRESVFSLSANTGRFDTANPYGGVDRTDWFAGVGTGFDLYAKRWLAVFGNVSYTYSSLHDVDVAQTDHAFNGAAGVGLRIRDTRIDLQGGEQVVRTAGSFGSWRPRLALSAFTVIRHRVSLEAAGTLIQGGASGSLTAELFPTKKTGVFASAFAGRFEPYDTPQKATRYIGEVGVSGWIDRSTGFVGRYFLTDETDQATPGVTNGYHELSHTLELEIYLRFS